MSYHHSTRTGAQKKSLVNRTVAKYCQILPSIQPARLDIGRSTYIEYRLSTRVYKPKRPFTKCERQFSFCHTLWLQTMAPFQMPLSTHRGATAAPSSWHCEAPQPGSQRWVKLQLQWQDLANRLWLPIKLVLINKNVFFHHSHFFTSRYEHSWNFPRSAVHMSLSHISKTLKWLFLFFFFGLRAKLPFESARWVTLPNNSH